MESTRPIRLPAAVEASRERVQVEISAAIELVVRGAATRVVVAGLRDVESIAADALARAQAAGVRFNLTRDAATGAISVVVGPLAE
jgi:intracellular sulfur oxidation DsrE/DsrF family protein